MRLRILTILISVMALVCTEAAYSQSWLGGYGALIAAVSGNGGKTAKIKLTGSVYEPLLLTIGNTGRTEVISSLPYTVEIPKNMLPIKLKFQSESYLYYDIDVPKKPLDTTGHVYLVKVNETAMALMNNNVNSASASAPRKIMGQERLTGPIEGIDVTYGVNAAPITNHKSENTVALIIANEKYEMAANVDNSMNDGLAFKEYCIKTLGIPAGNVKYSSNLTYGKMRKAFNDAFDLAEMMKGNGKILIYYSGHGIPDNKTKDAYLMPVDADGTDTDVCMSLNKLYSQIDERNIDRCVVFLDACFSGAQRGGDMIVAARGVRLKPKEAEPTGKTIVFSATSDDEAAYSYDSEQHGLFTYFLLSKLQQTKGNVSLGDLAEYITDKVSLESRRINNNAQTPHVSAAPGFGDSWKSFKLHK